jgi:hypothetical protein
MTCDLPVVLLEFVAIAGNNRNIANCIDNVAFISVSFKLTLRDCVVEARPTEGLTVYCQYGARHFGARSTLLYVVIYLRER